MKEISLKKPAEKKPGMAIDTARESFPSFTIYDNAPEELLALPLEAEIMVRVKKTSEEKRSGKNGRKSVGFDVLSAIIKDASGMEKLLEKHKMPQEAKQKAIKKYMGNE